MQLSSPSISAQAACEVRQMIVRGELGDGTRINEVRLAAELGVSRTPLREGLGQLVAERVVRTEPRRGFFVAPLTIAEFEQLYDIRPLLDPEALRLAGVPSAASLDRLDRINRRMLAARTAPAAIDLDDEWHMELLAGCPNRVLVELIQLIIGRTRRYEHALFRETEKRLDREQRARTDRRRARGGAIWSPPAVCSSGTCGAARRRSSPG
jgi:DNA-binding GntR family transcriptional regulator